MAYNPSYNAATYVNWSNSQINNASVTNSVAHWYSNLSSTYKNLISTDAIYCNDMSSTGSSTIYYGAYNRLTSSTKTPTFKCANNSFKQGYGLMTADEVAFAGGVSGINSPYAYYYLNSAGGSVTGDKLWWTMSPYYFNGSYARVFFVYGSGYPGHLSDLSVNGASAVRPVVSLKSSVLVSGGNGTSSNPYTVE